ncbi:MAG: hypothetical protein ABIR70_00215 [Bryobacteraceae bacterium]
MNWSRLQTIVVAMLLLVVSSYCATECTLAPCHEVHAAAKADQPPPCHQHKQQPKQEEAPPNCLHSQLVMDTQAAVSLDVITFEFAAILPAESILLPASTPVSVANAAETSQQPSPRLVLSTVLRI